MWYIHVFVCLDACLIYTTACQHTTYHQTESVEVFSDVGKHQVTVTLVEGNAENMAKHGMPRSSFGTDTHIHIHDPGPNVRIFINH